MNKKYAYNDVMLTTTKTNQNKLSTVRILNTKKY